MNTSSPKKPMLKRIFYWFVGGEPMLSASQIQDPAALAQAEQIALHEILIERQAERRGRGIRRILVTMVVLAVIGSSFMGYFRKYGHLPSFGGNNIGVVNINGGIGGEVTSKAVIPVLRAAMESNVKAVVLHINTPGGSPSTAEEITSELDYLKKKTGKPVIAVIDGVGASAGYMIAVHADRIVAGKYSLVGSIGAIMATWNAESWPGRLHIEHHVFKSGSRKDMLSPYRKLTEDEISKAQETVQRLAEVFKEEVKAQRGSKLKPGNTDLYTGEVWSGQEALALGLVDSLGTVSTIRHEYDANIVDFGPTKEAGLSTLFAEAGEAFVTGMTKALVGFHGTTTPEVTF